MVHEEDRVSNSIIHRKKPNQAHSTAIFNMILESVAHILESDGDMDSNTNPVAKKAVCGCIRA